MSPVIVRQLVGYNPNTENVAVEYQIPLEKWNTISQLVEHDDEDPDYIYAYPLESSLANDIIGILGETKDQDLKYFLEYSESS